MGRGFLSLASLFMCLALTACSTSTTQNTLPMQNTNDSYKEFKTAAGVIGGQFRPTGFETVDYSPENAVYYNFEPAWSWGKRGKTVVAGDDSRPTQQQFIYVSNDHGIMIQVNVIFSETELHPDLLGWGTVDNRTGHLASGGKVELVPQQSDTFLFSYGHALILVTSLGTTATSNISLVDLMKRERGFISDLTTFIKDHSPAP